MAPQRKQTAITTTTTAACAKDAFPSDLYGKYKRATDFFLHWLLRTCSGGGGNSKKHKKQRKQSVTTLDVYEHIVKEIVLDPTALPPELLQLWRRALAACETAITLRARVALFFAGAAELEAQGGDHDSHAHFLERLRSWLAMLQQVTPRVVVLVSDEARVKPEAVVDFANFYSVLELPDDYFCHEKDTEDAIDSEATRTPTTETTDSATQARSTSKIQNRCKQLPDETGDNEFYVELSFFFMELEELLEAVHNAFLDVKHQKKTLVEATAITKVAVDCAVNVIVRLELRYPWIRSCDDVMTILDDVVLTPEFKTLWDAVLSGWSTSPEEENAKSGDNQDQGEGRHAKFVPGSIVVDFVWVSKIVKDFVAAIPSSSTETMCKSCDGGAGYDEDQTPHYAWPCMGDTEPFFSPQLRLLYDEVVLKQRCGDCVDSDSLEMWFLGFFENVITTRTATLPCVFLVICWAHSVAVLQGNGRLRNTVRRSIMHCWHLEQRLREVVVDPHSASASKPTQAQIDDDISTVWQVVESTAVLQANPILAGCVQIDLLVVVHDNGTRWAFSTHRFKTFAHCYNALVQRELLDAIPVVEDVLQLYESTLFKPTRRATGSGEFVQHFFDSLKDDAPGQPLSRKHRRAKPSRDVEACFFGVVSRVFRLLYDREYSVLPATSTTSESWKTLLSAVSDLCSEELFGSQVLSRDVYKLGNDITSAFHAVCDEVMKPLFDSRSTAVMPIMDSLQSILTPQELMILSLLSVLDRRVWSPGARSKRRNGKTKANRLEEVKSFCSRAAEVVSRHFAQRTAQETDLMYFIYPQIRGHAADNQRDRPSEPDSSQAAFDDLMEMLAHSQGPLPDDDFNRLKEAVGKDPTLLHMRSKDTTQELCTLLHHAAAGPAHDRRLLKWLVQAEALEQANPISFKPADESTKVPLLDMTALHCAAKAGLVEMVRLLLEAGLMRDLNTVTAHSKESLAHLAVKYGHRELLQYLVSEDADLRLQDAAGNSVYELVRGKVWHNEIPLGAQRQHECGPRLQRPSQAEAAEQSRQSLVRYCNEKRAALSCSRQEAEVDEGTRKAKAKNKKTPLKAPPALMATRDHGSAMEYIQQRRQ